MVEGKLSVLSLVEFPLVCWTLPDKSLVFDVLLWSVHKTKRLFSILFIQWYHLVTDPQDLCPEGSLVPFCSFNELIG